MKTFLKFVVTGVAVGLITGWLFSLVSGNIRVVVGVGLMGLLVGIVLGFIHRNDE
jgi:hypothetical protein